MYRIIGHPVSRSSRIAWTCEELGLEWQYELASPHSDLAFQHNPSGKVPILLDGEASIVDSVAAITYLADKHGALTHPAGSVERAQQDSFMQLANDELDGALWLAAKHRFALPKEQQVPEIKDTARWEWDRGCAHLAQRLGDNQFAGGDMFTIADIVIGHCAGWAISAKFDWPDGLVGDYFARVQSREAWKRARAKGRTYLEA